MDALMCAQRRVITRLSQQELNEVILGQTETNFSRGASNILKALTLYVLNQVWIGLDWKFLSGT